MPPAELSRIEPAAVGFDSTVLAEIRPAIEDLRQRQRLTGAVIAILRRGHDRSDLPMSFRPEPT